MLYGTAPAQSAVVNTPAAAALATALGQTPATVAASLGNNTALIVGASAVGLHLIGAF
jgi:hypothetical protein